jgi:hypothetical protein
MLRSEATSQSSIFLSSELIKLIFLTVNIKKIKPGTLIIVSSNS